MKKILFVEDDPLVSGIYSQKLAEGGYEVVTAPDGLVAMIKLPELRPDLVVLDLAIPKFSGVDVLKFIRQRADLAATHVVVLSNWFLGNIMDQVTPLGIQGALAKSSATPARLLDIINKVMAEPAPPASAPPADAPAAAVDPSPAIPTAPPVPEIPALPPPPAAAAPPIFTNVSEAEFKNRMQREFLERIPDVFKGARQLCGELIEVPDGPGQVALLEGLHRKIGFLTQMTAMAGYSRIAELSGALEALLFESHEKGGSMSDSCRHTIVSTVAFLADSLDGIEDVETPRPPPSILVVDDDAVSNRAIVMALSRAKLSATSITDPLEALRHLQDTPYDLLLLDVNMPNLDGMELCRRIRELPLHKRTPAIFVTILTDFKTRARAILTSGNDLITKPIMPVELCVKVITHLLKFETRPKPAE